MISIVDFLSGKVPGGILLFLLIIFILNLSLFYFYRGSRLFSKEEYKKKATKSSLILFGIYISLWFVLRPPQLPDSILFVPFQNEQTCDFAISDILEQQVEAKLSKNYRLHYWEWFYRTCNLDSINFYEYRRTVAERLKIKLIVSGQFISDSRASVIIKKGEDQVEQEFEFISYLDLANKIISKLQTDHALLSEGMPAETHYSDKTIFLLTKAKLLYLNADYDAAIKLLTDTEQILLKAKLNLKKGVKELNENKKSMFEENNNPYFQTIIQSLIPIAREGKDTATLNKILGELYLYEKQYEKAEIFLKKALTQNPYDARIFYDMYFLHEDRIKDLGFDNQIDVLKKAVALDNGFVDAVHDLADEYFQSGTASHTGKETTIAIETLNRFLKINPENKKILNLLANIYLQIKFTKDAINIYTKLIDLGNNSGEIYYNLGIGYFHLKQYDKAESSFLKSINQNEYPDSYLYLGAINKILGNNQKALYYYRERIKRKQGDDDLYAKEAMHGIRLILSEQAGDTVKTSN